MIRPIRGMTHSMLDFSRRPDDPGRIIGPTSAATRSASPSANWRTCRRDLQRTLGEQKHLADLGLAVSKINHDMRNILASAQLMSDRLRLVEDPTVQSLRRSCCKRSTAPYPIRAASSPMAARRNRRRRGAGLRLAQVVDDVGELLGLEPEGDIEFVNAVDPGLEIDADADQLFRVLTNLCRNAVQAMQTDTDKRRRQAADDRREREGTVSEITIDDTGPGLPKQARENLFAAFRGSARSGGTGLGPGHRARTRARPWRHAGTGRDARRAHDLRDRIPDQPVRARRCARKSIRRPA